MGVGGSVAGERGGWGKESLCSHRKPLLPLSLTKIAFAENVNRLLLEFELCRHQKLILTGHFA